VADVSFGSSFIMAIKTDGTLWAWGENWDGQLGNGRKGYYQHAPIKVMDSVLSASSAYTSYAMVIKRDGSLWTWGVNFKGNLGLGEEIEEQLTPKKVMDSVVSSEMCHYSVYAIKRDATLWAWGEHDFYQLGDGTNIDRYIPVKIMDNVMVPEGKPSPWARNEIESLAARGIIPSALKDNYQAPIHRDEFTALMVNMYESVKGNLTTYNAPFVDIKNSSYKVAIEKAKTIALIDGTSERMFVPNGLLTREQAAKILCNVVSKIEEIDSRPNGPPNYSDNMEISNWAVSYVAYAQENKIMTGSSTGRFHPLRNLSREEAMLTAERLIVQYGW
jgi:hypothetical protein